VFILDDGQIQLDVYILRKYQPSEVCERSERPDASFVIHISYIAMSDQPTSVKHRAIRRSCFAARP
jgi:hypothetical protein